MIYFFSFLKSKLGSVDSGVESMKDKLGSVGCTVKPKSM